MSIQQNFELAMIIYGIILHTYYKITDEMLKYYCIIFENNNANVFEHIISYFRKNEKYEEIKYFDSYENYGSFLCKIARIHQQNNNFEIMKKYYIAAIDQKNEDAMYYLGTYYKKNKNYDEAEKYYLMAIENGHSNLLYDLRLYQKYLKNYDKMVEYFKLGIEKEDMNCMKLLGDYYKGIDTNEMKKYYLMAINK